MQDDIQRILIDRTRIQSRVAAMAQQIAADYAHREFLLMPLLTGSIIFVADLVRHLPVRMRIDVLAVSSYPGRATAALHAPRILYPTTFDVVGKDVLVIDDILDSGRTLRTVCDLLADQGARAIRTCVLLKKNLRHAPQSQPSAIPATAITADYIGFEIPDEFVVGYGLDFNGYYRNLPDLAVLHPHIFTQSTAQPL